MLKRLLGGLLVAIVLATVLAWANAGVRAADGQEVLIPTTPMTEEERAFKEWCAGLPNWKYLLNPGCWIYF